MRTDPSRSTSPRLVTDAITGDVLSPQSVAETALAKLEAAEGWLRGMASVEVPPEPRLLLSVAGLVAAAAAVLRP